MLHVKLPPSSCYFAVNRAMDFAGGRTGEKFTQSAHVLWNVALSTIFNRRTHHPDDNAGPMDPGMASGAKRDHQVKGRLPRCTMVNDNGAFVSSRCIAHPAAVPVSFKHFLTKPSKVFLILPFERVADGAHPMRENLSFPASAVHHVLSRFHHHITSSVFPRQ